MLSQEANDRLTRVGPGTPCGEVMRRYWIPIAPLAQLLEGPVRKVRVLGEDLVLYRDRQGGLGLVGERCAHRAVELRWGIPDENGLRCPSTVGCMGMKDSVSIHRWRILRVRSRTASVLAAIRFRSLAA